IFSRDWSSDVCSSDLTSRLLFLTCIIFAFARPYFPDENNIQGEIETVIYLDNSYSMQAQGQRGSLLERSKQELLEQLPEEHNITLLTNNEVYTGVSRQDIQEINFSPIPPDLNSIFLSAGSTFSSDSGTQKKLLLLSRFKERIELPQDFINSLIETYILPLKPQNQNNVSIDSLYYKGGVPGTGKLGIILSYTGEGPGSIPVSFYNGNLLLGKTSVEFTENIQEIEFPLSEEKIENGRLEIEDNGFQFDNTFYFSLNQTPAIKVTSINAADAGFLNRIYIEPEFVFSSMEANRIDYNILSNSQVVILNEVVEITGALSTNLLNLSSEDAIIVVIMPTQPGPGLIDLLRNLGFNGTPIKQDSEKLVTGISFEHPLYDGVFDNRVRNFEYPRVQESFRINQLSGGILNYEDNTPFLISNGRNYLFTAPLNRSKSNFTQSPLIVPTFYNIGIAAKKTPRLYYELATSNTFDVTANISGDRILEIVNKENSFIPRQQSFVNM